MKHKWDRANKKTNKKTGQGYKVIRGVSPTSSLICIHANYTHTYALHLAITSPEQNRTGTVAFLTFHAQEQPAFFTRPDLLARSSACGLRCQIMPGWKSRLHIVLFQEHSPTEPVYTNKRFTVVCISEF